MNSYLKNAINNASVALTLDLNKVKTLVLQKLEAQVKLIPDIATHIISSGGKRIRPTMVLLASRMFNYNGDKDILLAAAVEFIHTATLLHDDVIDENTSRRGVVVPNQIWGNKPAILVGDYLFAKSFELMVETKSLEVLDLLAKTSSTLVEGEVMQFSSIGNLNTTMENYTAIIEMKTSSLFSSSVLVGAILAGASLEDRENITNFAKLLGNSFQMLDDLIDYLDDTSNTGKNIGTDFYEQKVTLPIILLKNKCTKEELKFLKESFEEGNTSEDTLKTTISLLIKYNCKDDALQIIKSNNKLALSYLNKININNEYKDYLANMVSLI